MNSDRLKNILLILFGNFLYALVTKLFIIPANLVTGGTTGIGLALEFFFKKDLSMIILAINLGLLILGYFFLGKDFFKKTILSTITYPIFIKILDLTLKDYYFTKDFFLCLIYAGIGIGVSVGICMRADASTGGLDIPPLIFKKYFKIPVGISIYLCDFLVLVLQVSYQGVDKILWGLLLVMIYSYVADKLLIIGKDRIDLKIISQEDEKIKDMILNQIDRGVTILYGEGGFTSKETSIVLSIVSNKELSRIEKLVHNIDPNAFIIITKVTEVAGKGFTMPKNYIEKN